VKTADQVAAFPLVAVEGTALSGGAIPIFTSLCQWPFWVPFCTSSELLKRFSATRAMWLLCFAIPNVLEFDTVVLVAVEDRLESAGCIDVVMRSPRCGRQGGSWLGVTVPQSAVDMRIPIVSLSLQFCPLEPEHGNCVFHCEVVDKLRMDWLTVLFWRTMSSRVLQSIMDMHQKWSGSELEAEFASQGDGCTHHISQTEFFLRLHTRIKQFVPDCQSRK